MTDEQDEEWEWVVECEFGPPHSHTYPSDWQFGGADGSDPRADPRYKSDTYVYISDRLEILHTTQVPLCDDEAIDRFTDVARYGSDFKPKWLQVIRHGERTATTLPVTYDVETDEVFEHGPM